MPADHLPEGGADESPEDGRSRLGRSFWRLWAASGLSNLADGIVKVALPLAAIDLTRSPTLVAGLTFAATLPWLVFALHAGALADRFDRRRAMLGANTLRAALLGSLALAVWHDAGTIWALYAVAVGVGTAETVYDTSAQALLPQLVAREQLTRANGRLYAVELTANEFVGPPLAGFLAAAAAAIAFAAPAGLWLLAVAALLLVRGRFRIERLERTTMRADIGEGLRFLWRHRLLRTLAAMVGVFNFASSATLAVLVLYAVGPGSAMGLSEPAYGTLLATIAVGSLVGSFAAAPLQRWLRRSRALALSLVGGALLVGAPALTTDPYALSAAFFVGGVAVVVWNVITVALRQRIIPNRLLGRVNSGYRLVAWGTRPLGAAAGGLIAELAGLRPLFAVMALAVLALLAAMGAVTEPAISAAERDTEPS